MYHRVQRAPWYLILVIVGAIQIGVAAVLPAGDVLRLILGAAAGVFLLLAACFRQLTVREESDVLVVQFGPLPLLRRRLPFAEIESATRGRTTILDGWGVHLSPRGGWTWNIWGFDCVDVRLSGGRVIHIGTDDPDGLESFLQSRIAAASGSGDASE